jgi:hypothetical protein
VLDQFALGLLEALGLAPAAFDHCAGGFVGLLLRGWLGADAAADRSGLGRGRLGLFAG